MVKTVLFDLDGTLLDTKEAIQGAFAFALASQSIPYPTNMDFSPAMGKALRAAYDALAPGYNIELLAAAHNEFQQKNIHLIKPFPHVEETLTRLQNAGTRLAVVTSRRRPSTLENLSFTGLAPYFEVIVTGSDVEYHKPHPEVVQRALELLGTQKENAFIVGDTPADIGAGKNAGIKTIGVLYGHRADIIAESEPDHLVNSFSEILPIIL